MSALRNVELNGKRGANVVSRSELIYFQSS
jgi:hypothetical protein